MYCFKGLLMGMSELPLKLTVTGLLNTELSYSPTWTSICGFLKGFEVLYTSREVVWLRSHSTPFVFGDKWFPVYVNMVTTWFENNKLSKTEMEWQITVHDVFSVTRPIL